MRAVKYVSSLFILLFGAVSVCQSQKVAEIVTLFKEGKIEEVRAHLPKLLREYPEEPSLLFISGSLQEDGEKAINTFTDIVKKFPSSTYADDALFKIAQYYFSGGFYITAKEKLQELLQRYPDSPLQEDVHYLLVCCLLATDDKNLAKLLLKSFLKRYPHSRYASSALNDLRWIDFTKERASEESNYAIQVGAFSTKENAENQESYLRELGYRVQMRKKLHQGKTLYLVWVGSFNDRQQAKEFGESMKKRLGLDYRVVKK